MKESNQSWILIQGNLGVTSHRSFLMSNPDVVPTDGSSSFSLSRGTDGGRREDRRVYLGTCIYYVVALLERANWEGGNESYTDVNVRFGVTRT